MPSRELMELPQWMIYQSFRYCLGRQTYVVSTFVDWAMENWTEIPEHDRFLIEKEIEEELDRYEKGIQHALGGKMDREKWIWFLIFIRDYNSITNYNLSMI